MVYLSNQTSTSFVSFFVRRNCTGNEPPLYYYYFRSSRSLFTTSGSGNVLLVLHTSTQTLFTIAPWEQDIWQISLSLSYNCRLPTNERLALEMTRGVSGDSFQRKIIIKRNRRQVDQNGRIFKSSKNNSTLSVPYAELSTFRNFKRATLNPIYFVD